MNLTNISSKVVSYRQKNQLTIAQMAQETGLSTALISQIERNLANPTLSVLENLAKTLGMSLSEFLSEEIDEESLVLRACQRENVFYNEVDKQTYHNILTPEVMKSSIRLALVHIEPKTKTLNGEFFCHKNDEIVFILSGTVLTQYDHTHIELQKGDTLRIPANKKHYYQNESDDVVEMLTIKTARNF
ncbi:MAG: cupin domain-containing protein [Vagococcus sp.]|uniref:helix-turn-helix domain-containing protein n=1 Tax=Vagococcus sp. TaxID=1933889 RepID=UPI002FC77A79